MKTFVPTTVLMLFAAIPAAQAAPIYTPHLEAHVASGELQARQLRSQLASRFSVSRDYREIMREADHVVAALDALHDAVHSRRSTSTLRSLVREARNELQSLDRRVTRSDYTQAFHGQRIATRTGYISFPPTYHPGALHVDAVQTLIDQLSANLNQLDRDLEPSIRPMTYPGSYPYPYAAYPHPSSLGPVYPPMQPYGW